MIISASRRTDIPCFYSEWLMNRVKAGYVLSRNPMNHSQVSRISLLPDDTDCFVFWTKDPKKLIPALPELDARGFKYYFQFTLTPYGQEIEKRLRGKNEIEETFIELSEKIGRERVIWRYDPIILNAGYDASYHENQFARLCEKLSGHTNRVIISFVDGYAKLSGRFSGEISKASMFSLAGKISVIAKNYNLPVFACCEPQELEDSGISRSACIDRGLAEKICGHPIATKMERNQRPGCGCAASVDIGAYDTCMNFCRYCYANHGEEAVKKNIGLHDPYGELLVGRIGEKDRIYDRKQRI